MRISISKTMIAAVAAFTIPTFAALAASPSVGGKSAAPAVAPAAVQDEEQSQAVLVEQRITALRAKLQIIPAQRQLWDSFVQVMRQNAVQMDESFTRRARTAMTMTAAESMTSYSQFATAHAQGMKDLLPPFNALYASMSDLQKRATDQVFRDDLVNDGRQGASR